MSRNMWLRPHNKIAWHVLPTDMFTMSNCNGSNRNISLCPGVYIEILHAFNFFSNGFLLKLQLSKEKLNPAWRRRLQQCRMFIIIPRPYLRFRERKRYVGIHFACSWQTFDIFPYGIVKIEINSYYITKDLDVSILHCLMSLVKL